MSKQSRSLASELLERSLVTKAEQKPFGGDHADLVLRRTGTGNLIEVMRILVRCGMSPRRAKEVVDTLNRRGEAVASVAHAPGDYVLRFAQYGVTAGHVELRPVNPKALRARLGLSQAEFAARFGLDDTNIKNWEQQRSEPPRAAQVLLNLIDRDPDAVTRILMTK